MGDLSAHFSRSEFACTCGCGYAMPKQSLVDALEELRAIAGQTLTISGPLRCETHNASIPNSASNSRHLPIYADGVDVKIYGLLGVQIAALAEQVPAFSIGGIGIYWNRCHVDTRPGRARWNG